MMSETTNQYPTILVVEDEIDVYEMIARVLKRANYTTIWAKDGSQTELITANRRPDMVLLDLKLPDCSGIDVLKKLKLRDKTIPVVILTGFGTQDSVRDAMEFGAYDYLTKPFIIEELTSTVSEALKK